MLKSKMFWFFAVLILIALGFHAYNVQAEPIKKRLISCEPPTHGMLDGKEVSLTGDLIFDLYINGQYMISNTKCEFIIEVLEDIIIEMYAKSNGILSQPAVMFFGLPKEKVIPNRPQDPFSRPYE